MMSDSPEDIFAEPSDVDPDTLSNLGPLRALADVWRALGDRTSTPRRMGRSGRRSSSGSSCSGSIRS
jgi:hypothetical protein